MNSEQTIRMQCLSLVQSLGENSDSERVLNRARQYADFVIGREFVKASEQTEGTVRKVSKPVQAKSASPISGTRNKAAKQRIR